MTIVARWLAADQRVVVARFRAAGFAVDGVGRIRLEGSVIEIAAAARVELAADEQLAITEESDPVAAATHPNGVTSLIAIGVATIAADQSAGEAGGMVRELAPDRALGARAVRVDGLPIVFLEPTTEGRLAASLARFGPSPVALYLAPLGPWSTIRGMATDGPFGRCRLLGGTPAWGPHLLVCDAAAEPSSTIGA